MYGVYIMTRFVIYEGFVTSTISWFYALQVLLFIRKLVPLPEKCKLLCSEFVYGQI